MDHLRGFGLEKIGVGHCTGTRAFLALSNEFPNRVFLNTVGDVMIVWFVRMVWIVRFV